MKKFLISLVAAVIFILPNIAQADTLDDFKNILASKHFFIKYTYQIDGDYYNTASGKGAFIKDKDNTQIMNAQNYFNAPHLAIEAYDGNNFYTEDGGKPADNLPKTKKAQILDSMTRHPTFCHLKIGNKLFILTESQKKSKTAYYQEVDEEFNFIKKNTDDSSTGIALGADGSIALRPAIIALLNEEDDPYTGKFLYRRAGSGTTENGLEYFDLKADMRNSNYLNVIRYTFENGVIKQISMALYLKDSNTGEISGHKTIIDVEEFNTNPDPKYFQLPKNFKKIEKSPFVSPMMRR